MSLRRKIQSFGIYELFCLILLILAVVLMKQYGIGMSSMGSVIFPVLLQAVVVAAAIKMAGYVTFVTGDFLVIILFVFSVKMYWYSHRSYPFVLLLGLLALMYGLIYLRYKELLGKSLECFLSYMAGLFGYGWYELLYTGILQKLYQHFTYAYSMNELHKVLFLSLEAVITLLSIGILLVAIRKIGGTYFYRIDEVSRVNKEVSWYILLIPWILGIAVWLLRYVQVGSILIVFGIQLVYIRMLVKITQLKEHLLREQQEKNVLMEYNSTLAKNIQEVRAIKHDIKNIFFTMGEYVERSNDRKMKEYYQEKIVPFASKEFKMNDLYVALQEIQSEPLRAFLYYKCMQGFDRHVDMQLQVAMDASYFTDDRNLPDLIRILGIFVDNAIEEAVLTPAPMVQLVLREARGAMSFAVKNPVRECTRKSGINKGTTTKGLGRGQGLEIAARIVDKYDDLLWNSYFQGELFVQSISAERAQT